MFPQDFYSVIHEKYSNDNSAVFTINFNPECVIYKAHFPSNPITPGACIIMIIKELFGKIVNEPDIRIMKIKNIKFLRLISPIEFPNVDFVFNWESISNNNYKLKVDLLFEDIVFSKISIEQIGK